MIDTPPILSASFTIEKLFEGKKYKLANYQREYTWTRAEVRALLVDLSGAARCGSTASRQTC